MGSAPMREAVCSTWTHLVGLRVRQWPQQHGIDDGEDSRVRADAEPQGKDGHQVYPGDAEQGAEGIAQVAEKFFKRRRSCCSFQRSSRTRRGEPNLR